MEQQQMVSCESVRATLAGAAPALNDAALAAHLDSCAACAAHAESAAVVSEVLARIPTEPRELSEQWHIALHARLHMAHKDETRRTENPAWQPERRWTWALGLAAAVVLVFTVMTYRVAPAPVGVVGYVEGVMSVCQAGATSAALGSTPLHKRAGIETATDAQGAIYLRERDAWWYVHGETRGRLDSQRVVALYEGLSWFEVAPGKGPFEVETPHGTVRVLGTSFGVSVDETGLKVTVARGRVAVGTSVVGGGQQVQVAATGEISAVETAAETAPPLWVGELIRKVADSHFVKYYPSVRQVPAIPAP